VDPETRLLIAVQRATARPVGLASARGLSHAGEHAGAWLAAAALGAAVDRRRREDWVRAGVAVFLSHAASVVVKRLARRVRPRHGDVMVHVRTPSRWSFPSSHATSTTTAAVVLAPLVGRWTFALPPMMAWSRMVLGVHHLTDVLSGVALGATIGAASERRRTEAKR
jgi:membrane-associated phospholipid phosphatase